MCYIQPHRWPGMIEDDPDMDTCMAWNEDDPPEDTPPVRDAVLMQYVFRH